MKFFFAACSILKLTDICGPPVEIKKTAKKSFIKLKKYYKNNC